MAGETRGVKNPDGNVRNAWSLIPYAETELWIWIPAYEQADSSLYCLYLKTENRGKTKPCKNAPSKIENRNSLDCLVFRQTTPPPVTHEKNFRKVNEVSTIRLPQADDNHVRYRCT